MLTAEEAFETILEQSMGVLANASFDYIAMTRGVTVLFFCIPIVILCEYSIYRLLNSKQTVGLALLACIYANAISAIAGMIWMHKGILHSIGTAAVRLWGTGRRWDISESIILGYFFLLTLIVEMIAVFVLRKKLKFQHAFWSIGLANFASYIVLAMILFIFMGNH